MALGRLDVSLCTQEYSPCIVSTQPRGIDIQPALIFVLPVLVDVITAGEGWPSSASCMALVYLLWVQQALESSSHAPCLKHRSMFTCRHWDIPSWDCDTANPSIHPSNGCRCCTDGDLHRPFAFDSGWSGRVGGPSGDWGRLNTPPGATSPSGQFTRTTHGPCLYYHHQKGA